jgi:hypothetical protein
MLLDPKVGKVVSNESDIFVKEKLMMQL